MGGHEPGPCSNSRKCDPADHAQEGVRNPDYRVCQHRPDSSEFWRSRSSSLRKPPYKSTITLLLMPAGGGRRFAEVVQELASQESRVCVDC